MIYKFEKLRVWNKASELIDEVYLITDELPEKEKFNLSSQTNRAATSVALNIAEGSTSQSDNEQLRFIGYAVRSLIEVIACLILISKRDYPDVDHKQLDKARKKADSLFISLQAFKRALNKTSEPESE